MVKMLAKLHLCVAYSLHDCDCMCVCECVNVLCVCVRVCVWLVWQQWDNEQGIFNNVFAFNFYALNMQNVAGTCVRETAGMRYV